ncbi:MAG: ArgE/DapE family deacylase [Alphaproteobacteria bacterium]|nr:ArgE/DapE family deacylase [Alphaproteobacteria bacterium]
MDPAPDFDPEVLHAALLETIEGQSEKQIQWLSRLVSFASTRGNERPCQEWLCTQFSERGWQVDAFTIEEVGIQGTDGAGAVEDADYTDALQVVADVGPGSGRSLILQGHVDVVPPGAPELWQHPPFEPRVADGFMHGRGTADMKVGIAEIVFALDALKALGYRPAGQVYVETVTEEECTGNGALATLKRGYIADACLIPEALGHRLLRAELGSVWFRVRILGRPGHVLAADQAANAIMASRDYVDDLLDLTAQINKEAKTHEWFGHIEDPVKFNLGKVRGGDWLGSVPSWCEIECRLSVLPGHANSDIRRRIADRISATAARLGHTHTDITWIGFQAEGHVFAPGTEAETVLGQCHKMVIGTDLESFSMTATSDTRNYDLYYGIPTLCYGGIGEGLHAPDERADLDSMKRTTAIVALFIARWCGLAAIER